VMRSGLRVCDRGKNELNAVGRAELRQKSL
jgi:hypothetical protein